MKWILDHAQQFKASCITELLNVSKSGYYRHMKRTPSKRSQENTFLLTKVKEIYTQGRQCCSSPRILARLQQQGYPVGHYRVARLMKEYQLQAKSKRKHV